MLPRNPRTFRQKFGRVFRWFRLCVWLLVLVVLCVLIYLDRVGLPDFAKRRVLAELREHGLELRFETLRLRWFRGIVGQNVIAAPADSTSTVQLAIAEVALGVDWSALRQRQFHLDSATLHEARLVWPLRATNQPARQFVVEHLHGHLAFAAGDVWQLTQLRAESLGSKLFVSGVLTNASRLGERIALARTAPSSQNTEQQLSQILGELEKFQFATPPEIQLTIRGDAQPHEDIIAELKIQAPAARSPHADWRNLTLLGEVQRVRGTDNQITASLVLKADHAHGPAWGQVQMARMNLQYSGNLTNLADFKSHWQLSLANATNRWGHGRNWQLSGDLQRLPVPGTNAAFAAELHAVVDGFKTEWAGASQASLHVQIPGFTNAAAFRAGWNLTLKDPRSRWGNAASLQINGDSVPAPGRTNFYQSAINVKGAGLATQWIQAPEFMASGQFTHPATNGFQPELASFQASLQRPNTPWGTATNALLSGHISQRSDKARTATRDWGLWADLEPFSIDWEWLFTDLRRTNVVVEKINCSGQWQAPELTVNHLKLDLYGGALTATGRLDVATRELRGALESNFELRSLGPLLATNHQLYLQDFSWAKPPEIRVAASVVLPPWITNTAPAAPAATNATNAPPTLLASLRGEGAFALGPGSVRGLPFQAFTTTLAITNQLLSLPAFALRRREGSLTGHVATHLVTQEFRGHVRSQIQPLDLAPLLGKGAQDFLKFARIPEPPTLDAQFSGNWTNLDHTAVSARGAINNFSYRGEAWTNARANILVANQALHLTQVHLARGDRYGSADAITLDFKTDRLYFTNIFSILPPLAVTTMIGPETTRAVEDYHFLDPPTVRLNGSLNTRHSDDTDMHFEIEGGRFNWRWFNLTRVHTHAHWVTNTLAITNILGAFYQGTLHGDAFFRFESRGSTPFRFTTLVTNCNFHLLMGDLVNPTNKFEGRLTANIHVTNANTADLKSWQGFGTAQLHDGLLWQAPIFGIFSPILNSVAPGLGTSRAKEAAGTYFMTNSVINTKDLEIRATPVRLHYHGIVDFDGRINAGVEAQLFRDASLIPRLVGFVLKPFTKLFEYKVTGTLGDPKSEPMYIPKFLLFPLRPFKTLKEMFQRSDEPPPATP